MKAWAEFARSLTQTSPQLRNVAYVNRLSPGARPPTPDSSSNAPPEGAATGNVRPDSGKPQPLGYRNVAPVPFRSTPLERIRGFLKKHHRTLWWLHSAYALGLGISVILFAQKGFDHARLLCWSLAGAWLLVIVAFRLFGDKERQGTEHMPGTKKLGFFAMTYALKNLYQGMLFFLVPFYWKAATFDSVNALVPIGLIVCAVLSTLDLFFDRVLMRFRILAGLFNAVALFGCVTIVIPALLPSTRTVVSLMVAAPLGVLSLATLFVRRSMWKKPLPAALLVLGMGGASVGAYAARRAIPPAPMYVAHAALGTSVREDGLLTMEVDNIAAEELPHLLGVTDVELPGGKGDTLLHVWRHRGKEILRSSEVTARVMSGARREGTMRMRSSLKEATLPDDATGPWSLDVETEDGQLVGRTRFRVLR